MRRALRLALVVVGLVAVVYGTASLTGGWLGTPPWWTRAVWIEGLPEPIHVRYPNGEMVWMQPRPEHWLVPSVAPRGGRELISGAVVTVGLSLVAFGAWPRRRRPPPRPRRIAGA